MPYVLAKISFDDRIYKALISPLQASSGDLPSAPEIVRTLVRSMAERCDVSWTNQVADMIDYFWEIGYADCLPILLDRLLDQDAMSPHHITSHLLPLVPKLMDFIKRRNISILTEPFKTTLMRIMMGWLIKALGAKPDPVPREFFDDMYNNHCTCSICREMFDFIKSQREPFTLFPRDGPPYLELRQIGASKRKHAEARLAIWGGAAVATWETIDRTEPEGLLVRTMACPSDEGVL